MRATSIFAITAVAGIQQVAAWGAQTHMAIGYIAEAFLAPNAKAAVQTYVESRYNYSLGPAATWADSVRYTAAFKFSAPFHFIDAQDDPLHGSCSVSYSRDCGASGCILSALSNYTHRLTLKTLAATEKTQALYFITHFLGDVGQPLHVENYEVGGNSIAATCAGASTNLHSVWDTGMPVTQLNALYGGSEITWANALVTAIKSGQYQSQAADWISCSSITSVKSSRDLSAGLLETPNLEREIRALMTEHHSRASTLPQLRCPLIWAQEANAYDCSQVFTYTAGSDLCTGSYYQNSLPIINLQVAKQGYRLAAWLNVIFDGATNLP